MFWNASAAVGATSPNTCCQAAEARGAIVEHDARRQPDAERRIANPVIAVRAVESRDPAGLGEAVGPDMHPGQSRERLGGDLAQPDAIADLAEDLAGIAVMIHACRVEEAGEGDGARSSMSWKA